MISLAARRLASQQLVGAGARTPLQALARLGAVQAQDYSLAKWALALRAPGSTDAEIEQACADGAIVRTHLLRPTWHFVAPADVRWLLALTSLRVHRINARIYRQLELDGAVFRRSDVALINALRGGRSLERDALRDVLRRARIRIDEGLRMSYVLMRAELDGVICSGPRRGKQFTYALLDERVPQTRPLDRPDAIVELSRRFFSSRGPATAHDFAKWSGLTVADARLGVEGAGRALESQEIDGKTYWFSARSPTGRAIRSPVAHLLSIYDEYVSSYKDRSAMVAATHAAQLRAMGGALTAIVIVNGRVVGTWKRRIDRKTVVVSVQTFEKSSVPAQLAISAAARKLGRFLGMPAVVYFGGA